MKKKKLLGLKPKVSWEQYTPTEDLVSTGDWEFNASLFNVKDNHLTSSESEVDILWIEKTRDFPLSKFNPLV